MTEFRIVWTQCPIDHNTQRVLFIEAANERDAERIARNHIERTYKITWFVIQNTTKSLAVPPGRVIDK